MALFGEVIHAGKLEKLAELLSVHADQINEFRYQYQRKLTHCFSRRGNTALHVAVRLGNDIGRRATEMLLAANADVTLTTKTDAILNALHIACMNGNVHKIDCSLVTFVNVMFTFLFS